MGEAKFFKNNNFNLQEHIYICCYSKQNNAKHLYNNTVSLGRELSAFHFNLPDGKAQVKIESGSCIIMEESLSGLN